MKKLNSEFVRKCVCSMAVRKFVVLCSLASLSFLISPVQPSFGQANRPTNPSDVPRIISYQGSLRDVTGNPVDSATLQLIVSLYADPEGTQPVWQGNYTTPIRRGVFNVQLGSGNSPLPTGDAMNKPLWLGIKVSGAEEMRPLSSLAATAYALNVPDNSITTAKIEDGAITS